MLRHSVQHDQRREGKLTKGSWWPEVRRRRDDDGDRQRRGRAPAEENDAGVAGPSGWRESLREYPAEVHRESGRREAHRRRPIARSGLRLTEHRAAERAVQGGAQAAGTQRQLRERARNSCG
jgi:hypothetical protein